MALAPHGGGCLQQFRDVLAELNANQSGPDCQSGVSSAKRLKSLLGELCKFLESEIESKANAKKNIIVEKKDASDKLETEQIKLNDCLRKEKDALKNLDDARRRKEAREEDKSAAERDYDKKRRELKDKEDILKGVAITSVVGSVLTFGLGAGPGAAACSASAAAVAALGIVVADAEKKAKNARRYYNDAVSEYNLASSQHSEAEKRKNEAQSRVQRSKDTKDQLIQKEELLQAELDCLTDFLQRLKHAELEVKRTWKISETLHSTLRDNLRLPVQYCETQTVVSLCKEILAKFQVLSNMQVLAIDGGNLKSLGRSFDKLQTNARRLKVQYNQATDVLTDFA